MRAIDGHLEKNISATTAGFYLNGGRYGIVYTATWGGGSVTLQALSADGSNWVDAATAWTANGYSPVDLPPGQYRLAVSTATAVYVSVLRVPGE